MSASYYKIQFVDSNGFELGDLTVNCITEEQVETEAMRVFPEWSETEQKEISGFYVTGASEQTLGKCWYCRIERVVSISVTRI